MYYWRYVDGERIEHPIWAHNFNQALRTTLNQFRGQMVTITLKRAWGHTIKTWIGDMVLCLKLRLGFYGGAK